MLLRAGFLATGAGGAGTAFIAALGRVAPGNAFAVAFGDTTSFAGASALAGVVVFADAFGFGSTAALTGAGVFAATARLLVSSAFAGAADFAGLLPLTCGAFAGVFLALTFRARTAAFAGFGLLASERGECAFTSSAR